MQPSHYVKVKGEIKCKTENAESPLIEITSCFLSFCVFFKASISHEHKCFFVCKYKCKQNLPVFVIYPTGSNKREHYGCCSKTNNIKWERCSLNFIILSTLMMLLLNKNSPSSCKDIRQGLWLCIRGLSCHLQACSSERAFPRGKSEYSFLVINSERIDNHSLPHYLSI